MSDYITKDSGKQETFASGAVRDIQTDKPRYDLIPVCALTRLAGLYARGAKNYGEHNWQKGIPYSRMYASLLRHVYAWASGDRVEDHLAAVAWNAFTLMAYDDMVTRDVLPVSLDDMNVAANKPVSSPANVLVFRYTLLGSRDDPMEQAHTLLATTDTDGQTFNVDDVPLLTFTASSLAEAMMVLYRWNNWKLPDAVDDPLYGVEDTSVNDDVVIS